jgi:hypothetical protein
MKLDMCISQTTQQELPMARSVTLIYTVCNTIYLVLLTFGVKNYETIEKLEFSSFSSALNTNTGKHHPVTYHERHREGVGAYLYFLFHPGVVKPTPRQLNPRERKPVHSVYEAGGVGGQVRSGRVQKISPPPRFEPRAVQPIASRYTDYIIPALRNTNTVSFELLQPNRQRRKSLE